MSVIFKSALLFFIPAILITTTGFAQKRGNYLLVKYDTTGQQPYGYIITNPKGDTITKLDTAKYYVCFSDTIEHFAIVGIRNKKGWWAIDTKENLLFEVYNTSSGEPSPDLLREKMIRMVGEDEKIGFANEKGQVVIKPQFEAASSFYKGKALIGKQCRQVLWCCEGEHADKHYITECKQTGFNNKKGQILYLGYQTFEQTQRKIGWKAE